MKVFFAIIAVFIFSYSLRAQINITNIYNEGIKLHDSGEYDKAIEKYNQILAIDSNFAEAYYEKAYTYTEMKKYPDALICAYKSLEKNISEKTGVYVLIGNILDIQGKPKESIEVLTEGIKVCNNNPAIYFNLSVTYYNQKDYDNAKKYVSESILQNPLHPGSHRVLANAMASKNSKIKTILPLFFYLVLNNDSKATKNEWNLLNQNLNSGSSVQQNGDKKNINLFLPKDSPNDSLFRSTELSLAMMVALTDAKSGDSKSSSELFVEKSKLLMSILKAKSSNNDDRIWNWYVSKFNELHNLKLDETFCYLLLSNQKISDAVNWINLHQEEKNKLIEWLRKL